MVNPEHFLQGNVPMWNLLSTIITSMFVFNKVNDWALILLLYIILGSLHDGFLFFNFLYIKNRLLEIYMHIIWRETYIFENQGKITKNWKNPTIFFSSSNFWKSLKSIQYFDVHTHFLKRNDKSYYIVRFIKDISTFWKKWNEICWNCRWNELWHL